MSIDSETFNSKEHSDQLNRNEKYRRFQFNAMTCPCEFVLLNANQDQCQHLKQLLEGYVAKYSRFVETSLLSEINRSAGNPNGCRIDPETSDLLTFIDLAYRSSDGDFDPTVLPLLKLWDFKRAIFPDSQSIRTALGYTGWQKIRWNKDELNIYLPRGMSLDFGGFVKEYIADQLVRECRLLGIHSGYINLGGDIAIVDIKSDESLNPPNAWSFGITNPNDLQKPSGMIRLAEGALTTSGIYARYFVHQGKCYSHLISPKTGYPVEVSFNSVSVNESSCLLAGFYSTVGLLKQHSARDWLEQTGCRYWIQ